MSARASLIGSQFMGQPGFGEELPCRVVVLLVHQNPPRQNAERTLDDAHVLVQHQMMDVGAVEQRADRRHQHDIVVPHQFPQFVTPVGRALKSRASLYLPLYPSYVLSEGYQMWSVAWRLLSPSRAPR